MLIHYQLPHCNDNMFAYPNGGTIPGIRVSGLTLCTHECVCIYLCGIVMAQYNTGICINNNRRVLWWCNWLYSNYPFSESHPLYLFYII